MVSWRNISGIKKHNGLVHKSGSYFSNNIVADTFEKNSISEASYQSILEYDKV